MGFFDYTPIGALANVASGPKMGQYQAAGLDEKTKGLIAGEQSRANQTNQQFANNLTAGTENAHSMLNPAASQHYNAALGGQVPPELQEAIHNKAQRSFDLGQANIQQSAQAEAPIMKQQATMMAAHDLMQQQNIFNQNVQMQNEANQQKAQARNSIISSIFGGIGAVGGGMISAAGKVSGSSQGSAGGMPSADSFQMPKFGGSLGG